MNSQTTIEAKKRGPYKKTTLKYKLIQYDKYANDIDKQIIFQQDFYDFYEIAKYFNLEYQYKDVEKYKYYEIINFKKLTTSN